MITIDRPIYLKKLISKMDNGMIKVITGVRRCGKSLLAPGEKGHSESGEKGQLPVG